ncbi:MAG TPA: hypothetical protein VG917_03960 [Patescibacteria group bacterium]|nr:hypothetical protein [Patescibacteria group bacterium]
MNNQLNFRKIFPYLFLGLFLIGLLIYKKPLILSKLNDLNLVPKPENLTEIYFDNYSSLEKNVLTDKPYSFSFVIHNLEGKKESYFYQITLDVNGKSVLLDSNSVDVDSNSKKVIGETYKIPERAENATIRVEFPFKNQRIFYRVGVI